MQRVIFYCINGDWADFVAKICEQLYSSNERVLVLCDSDEEVAFLDTKLWTFSKLSFIPHGSKNSISINDGKFCSIWLSCEIDMYNEPTCLMHNNLIIKKEKLANFTTIIDVVNHIDIAKSKKQFYKECGIDNIKCWERSENTWKHIEI